MNNDDFDEKLRILGQSMNKKVKYQFKKPPVIMTRKKFPKKTILLVAIIAIFLCSTIAYAVLPHWSLMVFDHPEESSDLIINNRTNVINGAFVCEDKTYIYYKNYSEQCALYRLDKKTHEKLKLAEAFDSGEGIGRPIMMDIIFASDDKVYFIGSDPEPNYVPGVKYKENHPTLYSVNKDGSQRTKLISDVPGCLIKNGYAYYEVRPGNSSDQASRFRYDLATGQTELFIKGMIGDLVFSDSGDKAYYTREINTLLYLYERDMNTNDEKVLASEEEGPNRIRNMMNVNYYNNALYYTDLDKVKAVKKFDLISNSVEVVSTLPESVTGTFESLVVTREGIFFVFGGQRSSSLYKADSPEPTFIMSIKSPGAVPSASFGGGYIIVTNNNQADKTSYIKAYTTEGKEVEMGF